MPMGMPMMGMPMMGMGVMPMGFGVTPTVAGGGLSMSLTMSGDASMGLLGLLMMRPLLAGLLGLPTTPAATGTGGMTEAQFRNALGQALNVAIKEGITIANPMTATQAAEVIKVLEAIEKKIRVPGGGMGGAAPPVPPRELERARAEVRRLAFGPDSGPVSPAELARARAEVRRLAAGGVARPSPAPVTPSELERARAEVRRLASEGARPVGQKRPAGAAVASGAR
jgi:hypothetical protein